MTMFGNRRRLVSRPVVSGVPALIGAVVLAVTLSGCGDRSADQAAPSSPSAAPSPSSQAPAGQGPYKVAATVPVEGGAYHLAVDPGTHTVYVAGSGNAVSVIDGAKRTITATVPVEGGAGDLAVDPGTHTVYATNVDNTVSVIDGATRTLTATVPVAEGPVHLAVDPGTHTVYVATGRMCGNRGYCTGDGAVSVIDGAKRTVAATVQVGSETQDLAADPTTHTLYVSTRDGVSVVDGATRAVTGTVPVGNFPGKLAVDPDTHTAYVISQDGLSVIDGATRTVTATVPLGQGADTYVHELAVDPGTVYVGDGMVSVIERQS